MSEPGRNTTVVFGVPIVPKKSVGTAILLTALSLTGCNDGDSVADISEAEARVGTSEIRFLVQNSRRDNAVYAFEATESASPHVIYQKLKRHCQSLINLQYESCAVVVTVPSIEITISDFDATWGVIGSMWRDNKVHGVYLFDPDNSTDRRRKDEIFVVDCEHFADVTVTETTVCRGTQRDPLTRMLLESAASSSGIARSVSEAVQSAEETVESDRGTDYNQRFIDDEVEADYIDDNGERGQVIPGVEPLTALDKRSIDSVKKDSNRGRATPSSGNLAYPAPINWRAQYEFDAANAKKLARKRCFEEIAYEGWAACINTNGQISGTGIRELTRYMHQLNASLAD